MRSSLPGKEFCPCDRPRVGLFVELACMIIDFKVHSIHAVTDTSRLNFEVISNCIHEEYRTKWTFGARACPSLSVCVMSDSAALVIEMLHCVKIPLCPDPIPFFFLPLPSLWFLNR
jgi:hypothetical protein